MSGVERNNKTLLKEAFLALDRMQAKLDALEQARREPIAIVGLACRFPKASNDGSFWTLLRDGVDAVDEIPPERWDVGAYFDRDSQAPGKMYTNQGGFLDEVDGFDAAFFGIAPREAVHMDPQQRLFLEMSWEALENAGRVPATLAGTSTGAFLGICNNDYAQAMARFDAEAIDAYSGTGTTFSVAVGRLSYILGLRGPSMAVDTACSSSLVALDLACQNLRAGRCDLALAGGVNLILRPESTVYFCKVRALSPEGRCKTFDSAADGYVRGEGCGVVVLKRLGDALRDGDRIRAVIRGSAVNHDGRSSGLTVPSGQAQEAVIRQALADAGVDPLAVSYVEAHGTGTPLGDPIELRALARAYAQDRPLTEPLLVGSVKTNLGHLEAAAGIAGVIKVVLALEHGEIPAHLHLNEPTPHVNWPELALRVAREHQPWMAGRRLAGVSSFGFGGTNAHVILEAAPAVAGQAAELPARPVQVVALSGKSEAALSALAGRYAAHLRAHAADTAAVADAAYTANVGRSRFEHRAAVVGQGTELAEQLEALARGTVVKGAARGCVAASGPPPIAFLFTGQGSQVAGMGRELYDTEPCFRAVIDKCAEALVGEWDVGLREVLFAADGDARLSRTLYTQPALYALECGLAALWRSWGIEPDAVLGHSVGEYAAAWVAGVFGLEAGARLVAARARLMDELPSDGAMAAVFAGEDRVLEIIESTGLSIAAVNGPEEVVISGDRAALETVLDRFKLARIGTRRLKVSQAFHSALLDPMLDRFTAIAGAVSFAPPRIGLVSNLSGSPVEGAEICTASYWRRQVREPVRFAAGMATLHREGYGIYLEIGPQPTLLAMGSRCIAAQGQSWLPSLRPGVADPRQILESLAELHIRGVDIDWTGFEAGRGRRLVDLPTYPFQRQKFWIDRADAPAQAQIPVSDVPKVAEPGASELVERLHAALPADRLNLVVERLQTEVARVLRLQHPPDPALGFAEMGMDSLMAVELRKRLESGLDRGLSSTVAFDYPNIDRLARHLLQEILQLEPKVAQAQRRKRAAVHEPIAVVGLACRFPGGANDSASFWQLLREGRDAVVPISPSRWSTVGWYDPDAEASGTSYCREGAFLDTPVDQFDARFFGIAPREAVAMDPQQRLLLELCWETLEAAGHSPERLVGTRAGVFVGINTNDYARLLGLDSNQKLDAYVFTGNAFSVAAGRISHILGLQGPCLAVDTACSSSLVAVHLACQSLQMRECDLALAGGVNLMLSPDGYVVLSRMRALAPDGRSKAFDASADGYGRGEGGGVLALKRLSDAVADGDRILALLRGSAVNHDGPSSGLTVPNGPAQQALIREALSCADVAPADIGYIEAHGTGTPLGDPIEVEALQAVYAAGRSADRPLIIGSVKTNIGHLEAAAGVAGLIKVVLAMQHGEIPPHLHFRNPSPQIPWQTLAVSVPTDCVAWPAEAGRRLAGVSAFGMSGTNAHVIVEEAPSSGGAERDAGIDRPLHLVTLSGRSAEALSELAGRYRDHVPAHPDQDLGDIGFTANAGRSHFAHRTALLASTREELMARLAEAGTAGAGVLRGQAGERPRVAFLFTGQGSQYAGMGRGLYQTQPVFRLALDQCAEVLRPYLQAPLAALLYDPGQAPDALDQTGITQPALFALEYALARLWQSWGIEPAVVLGHSVGEYVAACVAGVFTVEEALALLARRAQLMQALPSGGAMAAVWADEAQVAAALASHAADISIAAINGPSHVVIAGAGAAVAAVCEVLQRQGVRTQPLRVSHAFHSALMEPMLAEFAQAAAGVTYRSPQLRLIANVSGKLIEGGTTLNADYWVRHVRETVRFHDGLKTLQQQGCRLVLEIGPQPTLLALGQECPGAEDITWLASLRRGRDDWAQMLDSLAKLYVNGCQIDWDGFDRPYRRKRIALPTYPFQRKKYWADIAAPAPPQAAEPGSDWLYELAWRPSPVSATAIEQTASHRWLIFADRTGTAADLVARLRSQGHTCITVSHGAAHHEAADDFGIDPDDPDAVERLFAALKLSGPLPSRIVQMWSLDAPTAAETDAASLQQAQAFGPRSTLHIVQALLKLAPDNLPRLWLVTRGARPVDGTVSSPAQAPLWGVGQVLALENPEMWGGLIDLDPAQPAAELADLQRHIDAADGEDLVAFRGGNRTVARLVRSQSQASPAATTIRPDASYLVTGGLGSLGLKIAGWMVEQGARSVILLGRNPASAAAEDAIRAMQQTGAQISVLRGDVGRGEELARTLEEIERSLPPLRGIVHAAGVLDDGILFKQSWERFVRVMAPKVAGAWNLHELTRGRPLDFFVMFSSAAALLGSPGQGNYAAANAFLDVLAHHRRSLGLPALTIGWGPWSEVGMAADLAKRSGRQWIPQGVTAIDPADGFRVLGRLMKESRAQVGVLPVVWAEFLKQFPAGERPRVLAEVTADIERSEETIGAGSGSAILARLNEANGRERRDILVDYIQGEAARVMGMDDESPDPELGFFDMGLDSLMAVELKNHLSLALGVSLPATMVFRYPNIGTLARFLLTDVLALAEPVTPNGNGSAATHEVDDLAEISEEGLLAMLSDELGRIDSDRAGRENVQ